MASTDERTEPASPKRRSEARQKGQVARSQDLGGSIVMAVGLFAVATLAPSIAQHMAATMREIFALASNPRHVTSGAGLAGIEQLAINTILVTAAPVAGICAAAAVVSNYGQVGLHFSPGAVKPDFKRINPISGAKNVFGSRIFFELFKSLAKVAIVGAMVAITLIPQLTHLAAGVGVPPALLAPMIKNSAAGIAQRAAIGYLLIGIIDFAYQRRRHERQLKMTKQEAKDEAKQHQLPPEVRSALRRRQMQAARKRMMAAVPQADVVVTNPTHYAVALRYDGLNPAPEVIAKGKDLVAKQIRRIAQENDVPIVSNPPLARALHRSVEVGQLIPEELYEAVAQVLAFVYRLARRRRALA